MRPAKSSHLVLAPLAAVFGRGSQGQGERSKACSYTRWSNLGPPWMVPGHCTGVVTTSLHGIKAITLGRMFSTAGPHLKVRLLRARTVRVCTMELPRLSVTKCLTLGHVDMKSRICCNISSEAFSLLDHGALQHIMIRTSTMATQYRNSARLMCDVH